MQDALAAGAVVSAIDTISFVIIDAGTK